VAEIGLKSPNPFPCIPAAQGQPKSSPWAKLLWDRPARPLPAGSRPRQSVPGGIDAELRNRVWLPGPRPDVPASGGPRPASAAAKAPCMLLAEDTLPSQKLIVYALVKRGHKVEVAGNGTETVDLI